MLCHFELCLQRIAMDVFDYPTQIVLHAIIQAPCISSTTKKCVNIVDLTEMTNMHSRDIMKHLQVLQRSGVLFTCVQTLEKKKIHAWGIKYKQVLSSLHDSFTQIYNFHTRHTEDEFYCKTCDLYYNVSECLTKEYNLACPMDNGHDLSRQKVYIELCEVIHGHLLAIQKTLEEHEPKYTYVLRNIQMDG